MSFQAGEIYFDARPIPDEDAAAIRNSVAGPYGWLPSSWSQPGLLMAHADANASDASARPVQPFVTPAAAITFDGRLDNREDLRLQFGQTFQGEVSDAMLALAVYERDGAGGFAALIGDWSLAIWDNACRRVVLASDYAGARGLHYAASGAHARWSTRLKPLAGSAPTGELDDEYVAGLLTRGGSPDRTPYRGVYSVPPGHYVVVSAAGVCIRHFWTLPVGDSIRYRREAEYEERLRELLQEAVRCRILAGVPAICELSGGFDSSSIVCLARHLLRIAGVSAPLATLTYEHQGSRDQAFYQALESFCGFKSIHVSTAQYAFLTENGAGGALPTFWEQLHGAIATVAGEQGAGRLLTGMLGDLIMGNWLDDSAQVLRRFRAGHLGAAWRESLAWSYAVGIPIWWILGRAALAALPPSLAGSTWENLPDGLGALGKLEDSIAPAFQTRMDLTAKDRFSPRAWAAAPPERRKHFRGLIEMLELRRLQPPELMEHLSWTHPYSHRPLVQYMLSIPAGIVCGPGEPRRLMRRALHGLWPPQLRQRRSKDSFGGVFLDSLRPLAARLLRQEEPLEVVERGYVDPVSLKGRLERITHSLECNEPQLRQIILLEFWLRGRRTAIL